ncbi:endoplasmic reticulum membrane-associated RNA degradation protein [Gastrophryne carolinensis]
MFHIFWTCPKIKEYWGEVLPIITQVTGAQIQEDPVRVLLHLVKHPIGKYKKTLQVHLLNAAKQIPPTCLSPAVFNMVRKLGFEVQDKIDIWNILDKDGQVRWDTICGKVCYTSSGEGLDYAESVRQLGPLSEAIHTYLLTLSNEEFEEEFRGCFQWTNNSELFGSALSVLTSMNETKISLLLMKMTSCLERTLGDVYLTIGKDCPFLLRDLLASEELATIFSKSVMDVLRIFLGSPESLNLRNLLWHGFASPEEIPPKYCSVLLLLTAGLGQILQTQCGNTGTLLIHRPYLVYHNQEEITVFPDLGATVLSVSEKLVEKSKFVLANMVLFWKEAIAAFIQGRYADCAIVLLPQLEAGLRLLFTTVNNCPHRMLTAESNILYTTFDEILAKQLDDASDNNLPTELGEPAMEFLWDMLSHQEGPRVRDRLGHGEIQLSKFPRQTATDLLGFSIALLYKYYEDNKVEEEVAVLYPFVEAVESYKSKFHPIALLQKQLIQCLESLQEWSRLPSVCCSLNKKGSYEMTEEGKEFMSQIMHIISVLQHQAMIDFIDDDLDKWLHTDRWFTCMTDICRKKIPTLYCHQWVMEVVSILRKCTAQCQAVSTNVIFASKLKYQQWQEKTLRSRQRENYLRMQSSINTISLGLRLVLTLIIVNVSNIHSVPRKTSKEYQKYLKYLKSILQYAENASVYTNLDNNRWDGAVGLSHRIILKIKMFHDAQA